VDVQASSYNSILRAIDGDPRTVGKAERGERRKDLQKGKPLGKETGKTGPRNKEGGERGIILVRHLQAPIISEGPNFLQRGTSWERKTGTLDLFAKKKKRKERKVCGLDVSRAKRTNCGVKEGQKIFPKKVGIQA